MRMRFLIVPLLLLGSSLVAAVRSQESGREDSTVDRNDRVAPVSLAVSQSESDQHSHVHHPDALGSLPLAIDGAKVPERIPDALAYAHFLSAVAEHERASADRLRRRSSMIARVGLSTSDATALVVALTSVREQLDLIHAGRSSAERPTSATLASLQAQEESVLADARERAQRALSPIGLERLDRFVREQVKPRIKVYGAAPDVAEDD